MKKLSWLGPALLGSGAVASTLDPMGIDKLSSCESMVILRKAITHHQNGHILDIDQDKRDSAPLQSPSVDSISVDLDLDMPPNVALHRNQTHYKLYVPPSSQQQPPTHQEAHETETTATDHDPGPVAKAEAASTSPELRNPAPANRAIACMGAGLLSVMLIFTVFL